MKKQYRLLIVLLAILSIRSVVPSQAHEPQQNYPYRVLLPIIIGEPAPPNPFGFDMNSYYDDRVLSFANEAKPRWVRAGDLLWSEVEPQRGVYNWDVLARLENNVRRVRAMGFEPLVIIQQSPAWAQRYPGRLCSPPAAEYVNDFARFTFDVAARYADGPMAIHHWEIWNEPDYAVNEVRDIQGFGCWFDQNMPGYGGVAYGEMLRLVASAIHAANPRATVLGGALSYELAVEQRTQVFVRGILSTGAANVVDGISFHAYGEWGAGDLLIRKTEQLRVLLAEVGHADKPLYATEIAANCFSVRLNSIQSVLEDEKRFAALQCPSDFNLKQANYAARIYAESLALQLHGAFWFSLVSAGPDVIANGQLIDDVDGVLQPRPSFYAFRNSARLLQNAVYVGPPLREPPADQLREVQVLPFRKGKNMLYVFWVPSIDFPKIYNLPVAPNTIAICTDQLNRDTPTTYMCSDTNGDGLIPRAVNALPQYVEVLGQ